MHSVVRSTESEYSGKSTNIIKFYYLNVKYLEK